MEDKMKKSDIFNFIEHKNISSDFINKEESKIIIEQIISIADGENLHYLWSNYKSDSFIIRKKISCDPDIYIKTLTETILFNDVYFIIDKVCFSDSDDHLVFRLSKSALLELLYEFYWEFDEIYISDVECSMIISLNHNFELSLFGDNNTSPETNSE